MNYFTNQMCFVIFSLNKYIYKYKTIAISSEMGQSWARQWLSPHVQSCGSDSAWHSQWNVGMEQRILEKLYYNDIYIIIRYNYQISLLDSNLLDILDIIILIVLFYALDQSIGQPWTAQTEGLHSGSEGKCHLRFIYLPE